MAAHQNIPEKHPVRPKEEPSVIFIEWNEGRSHVLAPTFAEFAARLRPRDDEDADGE